MIRLDGWRLSDDDANHIYTFGSNVRIDPKGFLVVCENVSDFKSCYADIPNIVGNTQFGWDGQDKVRLFNSTGAPVDYVAYGSRAPWDEKASEGEASLALLNAELDNAHPASWKAERAFGSPGRENFTTTTIESDVKESIPNSFELMQNFPNPFNNSTRISFQIPQETLVSLSVFDLRGRLVATLVEKKLAAGRHVVDWDAGDLSSGLYFYQIKTADFKQTKRMILYK